MPVSRSDLLLVRQAIREGWPVSQPVMDAVVRDVVNKALAPEDADPRQFIAAVKVVIAMEGANQAAEFAARKEARLWNTNGPVN